MKFIEMWRGIDGVYKKYSTIVAIGMLALMTTSYSEDLSVGTVNAHSGRPAAVRLPERLPPIESKNKVELSPFIGQIGEDIMAWEDLDLQIKDYRVESDPHKDLIRFVFDSKNVMNSFVPTHPEQEYFLQGLEFRDYIDRSLRGMGYDSIMDEPGMVNVLSEMGNWYHNPDLEDEDGNPESVSCIWENNWIAEAGKYMDFPLVSSLNKRGGALEVAAVLLGESDGAPDYDMEGTIVRFENDHIEFDRLFPGSSVYVRYGDSGGHVFTILAEAAGRNGQAVKLVADSNRIVTDGVVYTTGQIKLRWMTEDEISSNFETETSQAVAIHK